MFMLKSLIHGKLKIRSTHILAVFFLSFIVYVGLSPLPQFAENTKKIFQGQLSPRQYIRETDEFYSTMLETKAELPLFQNKGTYINLNGFMANCFHQPEMNNRIKLKNNHLATAESENPDPETIRQAADNIIRFHDTHVSNGGNFLFVIVPSQISKFEDLLPVGFTDTTNDTADTFLSMLKQSGVPFLDLREELQKDGISITDAYFATDHHWTPQTGFWAYTRILDKLKEMHVIPSVDSFYTDPQNYSFDIYPKTFLGSSGRRTGIYYAGLDDTVILQPDFETDLSIHIPKRNMKLKGRYEDISYNTDVTLNYQNPDFYQDNFYGLYGWGDTPITHWRNAQAPEQGKFLLIGESFGNIPFSLMSIYFSNCDEVDMRHFTDDFTSYYSSYNPDTVIVEVNISAILSAFTQFPYLG